MKTFKVYPKRVTACRNIEAGCGTGKKYVKSSFEDKDYTEWTMDDYFEYLYDCYSDDASGAFGEIEASFGNWNLPPCCEDYDYSEIWDMYKNWLATNHPEVDIPSDDEL